LIRNDYFWKEMVCA